MLQKLKSWADKTAKPWQPKTASSAKAASGATLALRVLI